MDIDAYRYRHILLPQTSASEKFVSPRSGPRGPYKTPQRDRRRHSAFLLEQIKNTDQKARLYAGERTALGIDAEDGIYLQFKSDPDFELKFESLEFRPSGIELLAVKKLASGIYATVFVPEGKLNIFINKIEKYRAELTRAGRFRNKDLVESISDIRVASLESLWTDDHAVFPKLDESIWWEVWLRGGLNKEYMSSFFRQESPKLGIRVSIDEVNFPDRSVLLAYGTIEQMSHSVNLLNCIAELRKAKENPEIFTSMSPKEQHELVDEARDRIVPAQSDEVAVCLLDTGINRGHPLIENHLREDDMHAYDPAWAVTAHDSHGTEMAGLSLYGDLIEVFNSNNPIELSHQLESVKILPPHGQNDPRLYGFITKESIARAEVSAPHRRRVISMPVTAPDDRDRGQPSSWSSAVDQLAAGAEDGIKRLLILSAGNTDHIFRHNYPENNASEGIHDPSQAWNALCVGAYTEKIFIDQTSYPGWMPIAPSGDLSPSSCTSMIWQRQWPFKPDILLEGGNSARVPGRDEADYLDSLQLLTTHWQPLEKLLTVTGDTSAATSLAARMAAILLSEYPDLWPETVRALLVHSADWTEAMKSRFEPITSRYNKEELIRHYGFGVPNFIRARRSAGNSLTLIVQDELQPFDKIDGVCKTRDMHLHTIPWPRDVLESLGETDVEMRVSLSYFIEPNPARRGWRRKHTYASHGLRFEVINPLESVNDFRQRINKAARDEEYGGTSMPYSPNWFLGIYLRSKGSLHSDRWMGSASQLAQCPYIAVYPVAGWWKERQQLGRWNRNARYSLMVSIHTPQTEVDLYTPIISQISAPIEISTRSEN